MKKFKISGKTKLVFIVWLVSILSCEQNNDTTDYDSSKVAKILNTVLNTCLEENCIVLTYPPSIRDYHLDFKEERQKVIFSNKFIDIKDDILVDRIDSIQASEIYRIKDGTLPSVDLGAFDQDKQYLQVDLDTIVNVPGYIREMEVKGYSGIVFFIKPMFFQKDGVSFVVSGLRYTRSDLLYIYKVNKDGYKLELIDQFMINRDLPKQ